MAQPPDSLPRRNASTAELRLLDAAANRASEGVRVVEDYARFALDDRHLTGLLKQLRHDLTAALAPLPTSDRLAARETQADVGTSISTPHEQTRQSLADVATASLKRTEQALRSLEEVSKVSYPQIAPQLEAIRYRLYTLERAVGLTRDSLEKFATARLYVLVDGGTSAEAFASLVTQLIAAEVDVLQLRDKALDDRTLLARARQLRQLTAGSRTLFVMNDRPDLALLSQADGVHVGQEELTVKDVRTLVGPQMLIGLSTHSLVQAREAVLLGANYIGVGPTFPSTTKAFDSFAGLEFIAQVAAEIRLPAFAIGGITAENIAQVREAGLTRVAVGAAVTAEPDPASAARALRIALEG